MDVAWEGNVAHAVQNPKPDGGHHYRDPHPEADVMNDS